MPRKKKHKAPEVAPVSVFGEAIKFACHQFRNGVSEKVIVKDLTEANDKFTPENLNFIIHRASLEIANEYSRDRGSIIGLHIRRYNDELKKELANHHNDIELPHIRKQFRLVTLQICLDILFAKERVLQIHAKDTQIKIFNKLNAKLKEKNVAYDLSVLTLEEKIEFLNLVTKTKRTDSEVFSVKTKADIIETIDIDHEEVVPVNDNIKLITQTNLPVEERVLPEKNIHDVMAKVRAALEKKAKQEFEAKGAKQIAPNPIDLRHDDYSQQMLRLQEQQTHSE